MSVRMTTQLRDPQKVGTDLTTDGALASPFGEPLLAGLLPGPGQPGRLLRGGATIGTEGRANSWFDLSYESDGTIRLLAMLTALSQDPAPSVVGLEEPELAIHPGAMAVLSDAMKEAATLLQAQSHLIDRLPAR